MGALTFPTLQSKNFASLARISTLVTFWYFQTPAHQPPQIVQPRSQSSTMMVQVGPTESIQKSSTYFTDILIYLAKKYTCNFLILSLENSRKTCHMPATNKKQYKVGARQKNCIYEWILW